jgi:HEAT repeat protein
VAVAAAIALWPRANPIDPILDRLASVNINNRRSHPDIVRLRAFGAKAVPDLRRTFTEIESRRTRVLLWLKAKWPDAPKYIPSFPDPKKLIERRTTACQVLQALGPAGKAARPELIKMFTNLDGSVVNMAAMALQDVGIDGDVCEQLAALVEKGITDSAQAEAVSIFGEVKPPSPRVVKTITDSLNHSSWRVQRAAADTIDRLGLSSPEILIGLRKLQTSSRDSEISLKSSLALWTLETNKNEVLPPVFRLLENELKHYEAETGPDTGPWAGVIYKRERPFVTAAELFGRMPLSVEERQKALNLLEESCEKSGRLSVQLRLLRGMLRLGYSPRKGIEVCRAGIKSNEKYYRFRAMLILGEIAEQYPEEQIDFNELMNDPYVGVRVYAAKAEWLKKGKAGEVVPVLVDALDRGKYEENNYQDIQTIALEVLGMIGPEAKSALNAVETLRGDPDPNVAKLASETAKRIQS